MAREWVVRGAPAVLALVLLLSACGGSDPEGASGDPCTEGRACPRSCEDAAACASGEVCAQGFCAQPPPTSTAYAACAVDADCARGDFCSLGACTHDCVSDRDCATGQVCTNRGRCVMPEQAAAPAPEPAAARPAALAVSAGALSFEGTVRERTLTLRNGGSEPLSYRILSDSPWASAEPAAGVVGPDPVQIVVRVDAAAAGTDAEARLRINSTAGMADVGVFKDRDLTGQYAGAVEYTHPYAIARSSLALHLFQAADGRTLTGYVAPEGSLLFPVAAGVQGTVAADGGVELTVVLAGVRGSPVNPHYPRPLRRTLTLQGKVTPEGDFTGTLVEAIAGPLPSGTLDVRGSFQLRRSGPAAPGQAVVPPDIQVAPLVSPYTAAEAQACDATCPSGLCRDDLERAAAYLQDGVRFYATFQSPQAGLSPFAAVIAGCGTAGCFSSSQLRCAQLLYERALGNEATRVSAARGLLDTYEALADYYQLRGTDALVGVFEQWKKPDSSLDGELVTLNSAITLFSAGAHAAAEGSAVAMLDPWGLAQVLGPVPSAVLAGRESFIPGLLNDLPETDSRGAFEYLRRQAVVVSGALRARLELADRLHRLGPARLADARAAARMGAVQGFIDLVLLSAALEKAAVTPEQLAELATLLRDFQALSARFDAMGEGRNPAGYVAGYVPFFFSQGAASTATNFERIHADALSFLGTAADLASTASGLGREFESSQTTAQLQVSDQLSTLQDNLDALCGTADVSTCGGAGSQLDNARREVLAASNHLRLLAQRAANLQEEVRIERDRARNSARLNEIEARLVFADGRTLNALEDQEAMVESVAATYQAVGSLISTLTSPNPINAAGAIFGAAVSLEGQLISIAGRTSIDKARNDLSTRQRARVEFTRAQEKLIDSAALIETKLLETATLAIEAEMAKESLLQALGNLTGTMRRAQLLDSQIKLLRARTGVSAYRLLTFRMNANKETLAALDALRRARDWAYLATRAMEYEINFTYRPRETLWQKRTATELKLYLDDLVETYRQASSTRPQPAIETLSLRDTFLGLGAPLQDAVTGHQLSPRERFRRYIADPARRDVNGNLVITFDTLRPDLPVFSRAVCNDRIVSVRLNLVGDNLGAGVTQAAVRLTHGGTSYLRSCDTPEVLVPYSLLERDRQPRVAQVLAGINAGQATAPAANTDFAYRPVLAGPWTLTIDSRESRNASLDLRGLDDIELILEHEAKTLQQ